jgi:TP901 family phage tail tape measure protein
MSALNNLQFMISLIDRVSGPMGKVMKTIDSVSNKFQSGAQKIGYGVAGIAGAAYSINRLLEPTKEMQRALGEVKSLGVADDTLNMLRETALKFSRQYGGSAADVVRSSYDIQSAIAGLTGDELAAFTAVSGVLAKGTKANVADITNYVGTMYGIFQQSADAMGKAKWIEQMAAQTAMAVNIFKSDGQQMAGAFTAIGASAQNFGIAMAEQFAVLGQLQATMSGSEAGTKYRSFLDNVGKAQKALNLQFTDAKGRMLPIVDILGKINQKFGAIDTVAEADLLKKAFGTDEAVALIKLLNNDLSGLKTNIEAIGKQTGLDDVMKMADAMTDPWAKMKSGVDAISITIGTELLPVLMPLIDGINNSIKDFLQWTQVNRNMALALGVVVVGVVAAIGSIALFGVAAGFAQTMSAGWELATKALFKPLGKLATFLWTRAIPAIWSFSAALFANPLTWWVLGITAAVAIVAAAIYWWDEWTAVVIDFTGRFLEMLGVFALVDNAFALWEGLKQWWVDFKVWLSGLNPFESILSVFNQVSGAFGAVKTWATTPISFGAPPVSTGPRAAPTGGGILKQLASDSSRSTTIGDVNVFNYGQPMSGAKLRDELMFAGG